MKTSFLLALSLLLTLCFSTSELSAKNKNAEDEEAPEQSEEDGKRNTTMVTVAATPDQVREAALEALASIGCKIKKNNKTAIEGKRPNKVGLAVGSGGEKLFVDIVDMGDGTCEVTVKTKKTMVGLVGQKLWNEEVAQTIVHALE
ncbi:hypothetical protein QEH54_07820 [Pelagicoccus sp. SDUM812003]|nr:hypothetical protein [Pelagicoccus sp. SDUM812003]